MGRKGFQGKVVMAVGSGACVKRWLACDKEAAELGSMGLCRMGSSAAKGGGE